MRERLCLKSVALSNEHVHPALHVGNFLLQRLRVASEALLHVSDLETLLNVGEGGRCFLFSERHRIFQSQFHDCRDPV